MNLTSGQKVMLQDVRADVYIGWRMAKKFPGTMNTKSYKIVNTPVNITGYKEDGRQGTASMGFCKCKIEGPWDGGLWTLISVEKEISVFSHHKISKN